MILNILPRKMPGKYLDAESVSMMEMVNIDICGENGEYHTPVVDGPIFKKALNFYAGDIIESGHYAVADVR